MDTRAHNHSCRNCKRVIAALLARAAGPVVEQYDLRLPARLESYQDSPSFDALSAIHAALQQYRGFERFVATSALPRVDYFLPEHRVVVEFDEPQHFTEPRQISLAAYPGDLHVGYDRERWIELCRRLNRRDNSPPFRDEQRAWYDTLRDFAAPLLGNRPTVRIFAGERQWCALDADRAADVRAFAQSRLKGIV
jgi:hypothetical protein